MEIIILIALIFIGYKLDGIYNVLFDIHRDLVKFEIDKDE